MIVKNYFDHSFISLPISVPNGHTPCYYAVLYCSRFFTQHLLRGTG
uniref:Uncharacterized protein n=1 Tax=Arundo donax TaxID=35708 RepID=A0A0A9G0L3_ARUDO